MHAKTVFIQIGSELKNHEFSAKLSSAPGARRERQNFFKFTKFWYMVSFPVNIILRALLRAEIYFFKIAVLKLHCKILPKWRIKDFMPKLNNMVPHVEKTWGFCQYAWGTWTTTFRRRKRSQVNLIKFFFLARTKSQKLPY